MCMLYRPSFYNFMSTAGFGLCSLCSHYRRDVGRVTTTVTRLTARRVTCPRVRVCDVTSRANQWVLVLFCRLAYQSAVGSGLVWLGFHGAGEKPLRPCGLDLTSVDPPVKYARNH